MSKVDYVCNVLLAHSEQYQAEKQLRELVRAEYSTLIGVSGCMDGRCDMAHLTKTPDGILQPWRNLGGKFEFGWPYFGSKFNRWLQYGRTKGTHNLFIATYHFSAGSPARGCRAFGHERDATAAAMGSAETLRRESKRLATTDVLSAFTWGIETDRDALILHGERGQRIDLAEDIAPEASVDEIRSLLSDLYPTVPTQARYDVIPLIRRNLQHIADVAAANRPVASADHREWILVVGHGFHFQVANTALIIGPWDPDMSTAITTAAKLLHDNLNAGRINLRDGLHLVSCWPCGHCERQQHLARERVLYHQRLALATIAKNVPEISRHLETLALVTTFDTRKPIVINHT